MHLLSGMDFVEISHYFAMKIHMIQVLIEIKGIFKIFSKFIVAKTRNIYYMFDYFLISHFLFTQNCVTE